mmetsp:Transcript_41192/g.113620  ORF Transcript_41192/g.113620 Transcript_41192/m.113620 type:complete len:287 (-) Transcript_41192:1542-2402(-)
MKLAPQAHHWRCRRHRRFYNVRWRRCASTDWRRPTALLQKRPACASVSSPNFLRSTGSCVRPSASSLSLMSKTWNSQTVFVGAGMGRICPCGGKIDLELEAPPEMMTPLSCSSSIGEKSRCNCIRRTSAGLDLCRLNAADRLALPHRVRPKAAKDWEFCPTCPARCAPEVCRTSLPGPSLCFASVFTFDDLGGLLLAIFGSSLKVAALLVFRPANLTFGIFGAWPESCRQRPRPLEISSQHTSNCLRKPLTWPKNRSAGGAAFCLPVIWSTATPKYACASFAACVA